MLSHCPTEFPNLSRLEAISKPRCIYLTTASSDSAGTSWSLRRSPTWPWTGRCSVFKNGRFQGPQQQDRKAEVVQGVGKNGVQRALAKDNVCSILPICQTSSARFLDLRGSNAWCLAGYAQKIHRRHCGVVFQKHLLLFRVQTTQRRWFWEKAKCRSVCFSPHHKGLACHLWNMRTPCESGRTSSAGQL